MTDRSVVAEMRRAFDETFALPAALPPSDVEDLLAVRLGGDPYGIRLQQLSAAATIERLTPLPAGEVGILGLTGVRGIVIPVYSLAALLGYAVPAESVRWIAVCRSVDPIALSPGQFEGFIRVPRESLSPAHQVAGGSPYVSRIARTPSGTRPVLDLDSLVRRIVQPDRRGSFDK